MLQKLSLDADLDYPQPIPCVLVQWQTFDTALRNELVRIRAARKQKDAARYLRHDGYTDASTAHTAVNAYRNTSLLAVERSLDEARWRALDELAAGHYFDFDFLVLYALKLLLLERWQVIRVADSALILEEALR